MRPRDSLNFRGKTVLITGAATGIGRAVAVAFAQRGARLSIGDFNDDGLAETAHLVNRAGAEAFSLRTDVSDEDDVRRLVAETVRRFGGLDCAFNNAAIAPRDTHRKPIAMLDAGEFDRVIAVNLRGMFLSLKHELAEMARVGRGAILNTTSIAGALGEPGVAGYVAAKHGVIGLTRDAAVEYASRGIRVNALAPEWVGASIVAPSDGPADVAARPRAAPIGRIAHRKKVVAAVLHLCSDAAAGVTGEVHIVSDGVTRRPPV